MEYKKIVLKPKSWIITPLESDTILSYVFAFGIAQGNQDVINIFEDFKNWELLFLITNTFICWNWKIFIPKPMFFQDKQERTNISLKEAIKNESTRKKFKKSDYVVFDKDILKNIFDWDLSDEAKQKIIEWKKEYDKNIEIDNIWKNSIPRFNSWETNPFSVKAEFANEYSIFVKVFDKEKFDDFYKFMKNLFETIGFGAWKSRWFGKFKEIKLLNLSTTEKETFDYLKNLEKDWLKLVLNNYKPTDEELEKVNWWESFFDINWKNAKTIQEFNEKFFKWRMNFIKAGSVLRVKSDEEIWWSQMKKLKGWYYESNGSYNFGYIF